MHFRTITFRRNKTSYHGRQPLAREQKCIDVSNRREGHRTRIGSAQTSPCTRVQVSLAPSRFARYSRHRFSSAAEGYLRERLFLACTWMPDWPSTKISARILVTEAASESPKGRAKRARLARIGLGGADGLAMPNKGPRGIGNSTDFLSGATRKDSDRQFCRNPVS